MTRGVVIAMNPQTGEILAMVSLPTYDNNLFARGHQRRPTRKLLKDKDKPLLNHAIQAHYAPGSTYKLVTGTGGARRSARSPRRHASTTKAYLTLGGDEVLRVEPPRLGSAATSTAASATRATRSSTRSPACSASTGSATGRSQYGFGAPTGIDLPGEVAGHRPDQRMEAGRARRADLPRRDVPGRDRPGL